MGLVMFSLKQQNTNLTVPDMHWETAIYLMGYAKLQPKI